MCRGQACIVAVKEGVHRHMISSVRHIQRILHEVVRPDVALVLWSSAGDVTSLAQPAETDHWVRRQPLLDVVVEPLSVSSWEGGLFIDTRRA